jgi:hypothetical protein
MHRGAGVLGGVLLGGPFYPAESRSVCGPSWPVRCVLILAGFGVWYRPVLVRGHAVAQSFGKGYNNRSHVCR